MLCTSLIWLLISTLFARYNRLFAADYLPFDRVFIIVFENIDYEDALAQPYFNRLTKQGKLLTNYHALTHPSQPNYVAMISGSTKGVRLDYDSDIDRLNLVDRFEAIGKSWITYQEDYPISRGCFTGSERPYVRKHNPFVSFVNIQNNSERCTHIVNANILQEDIKNTNLADFIFYTPNLNNDGHDTGIDYAGEWFESFFEPLLANAIFKETLFIITFDENKPFGLIDFKKNHIYTLLIGPGLSPGSADSSWYDHYSIIATLVDIWKIEGFGLDDANAKPFKLD
ncbi:hypothetical protein HK103_002480 [Boothiomyces macroporosus]|uniref:Acid phosphatase n=1 Tax=Boothiomyces macroporosus TaxID=261099 RepID=A0AAD5UIT7_9FUNG|nr:hypothetical protein HK103_002480 [Boothiomyces macroporosus]